MGSRSAGTAMPSAYDPSSVERRLYEEWVERGYFTADPKSGGKPFSIVLPPPNVTGALHIGHALDHTLQDVIIRRRRMQGYETLWLPGTDHAGIATQNVVERELAEEGKTRHDLGRERFLERVWAWKETYGNRIVEQMRGLGSSCDWTRLRFTMDEGFSRAVRTVFVRLFEEGLVYRANRIINWCPRCRTALADIEVEHEDVDGELIHVRYPVEGGGEIVVATTRVETMLADTGVAVHPGDERYRDLVGGTAILPLVGRRLPIVADEAVDPAFGTGAVKVTPGHDPTDFEIGERHGLPTLGVLTEEAVLNDEAPEPFRGLDRYAARRAVLERLREEGFVVREERPYTHAVGHCYRCGTEVEPFLSLQWFVRVGPLAEPAIAAAEEGRTLFFPARWRDNYLEWMRNLRDWCISRQLWWGHRIPVWYCDDCGEAFAALEDPQACRACGSGSLRQDEDVLDTWFSSALWPFATLGWPEETPDLSFFYPTSVLVTGYEILYLWVARMMKMGLHFMGREPFAHVAIHGLVRDAQGRKMSKSLGNVIDPLDMIERHGADALRLALVQRATGGQDIPLAEEWVEGGKHFANKLWNAARLVLSTGEGERPALPEPARLGLADRWLLSRHEACRAEVDAALEEYRFADAAQALYRFVWSELADWGLELAKPRLYEGTPEDRATASAVLAWVLERTLRLLHPIVPFVTEEIWRRLGVGESIVVAPWPEEHPEHLDPGAEERLGFVQDLVTALRSFRSDHDVAGGVELTVRVAVDGGAREALAALEGAVRRLARVGALEVAPGGLDAAGSARLVVRGAEVVIPLVGVLDVTAECERIRRRLGELAERAERSERKLANEGFRSKAPPEVVEAERARLASVRREEEALRAQLEELGCGAA